MYFDSLYGLSEPIELPWWMRSFALAWITENPVFQLRWRSRRRRRYLSAPIGLLIGMVAGAVLFFFLRALASGSQVAILTAVSGIGGVGMVIVVLGCIGAFLTCLVYAPLEFRREVETHKMENLLSLPVSDDDAFFGHAYPVFFRVLLANELALGGVIGLALVLAVTMMTGWKSLVEYSGFTSENALSGWLLAGLFLIRFTLILIIVTLAGGLYAINLPAPAAIVATIGHYVAISLFLRLVSFMVDVALPSGRHAPDLFDFGAFLGNYHAVLVSAIQAVLLILFAWLTGRVGAMTFARYRRPGFYEEEWASASGLMR